MSRRRSYNDYRQSYCRESNIYFKRMQTIAPPAELQRSLLQLDTSDASEKLISDDNAPFIVDHCVSAYDHCRFQSEHCSMPIGFDHHHAQLTLNNDCAEPNNGSQWHSVTMFDETDDERSESKRFENDADEHKCCFHHLVDARVEVNEDTGDHNHQLIDLSAEDPHEQQAIYELCRRRHRRRQQQQQQQQQCRRRPRHSSLLTNSTDDYDDDCDNDDDDDNVNDDNYNSSSNNNNKQGHTNERALSSSEQRLNGNEVSVDELDTTVNSNSNSNSNTSGECLDLIASRQRLERHVSKHLFWSRKAARKMKLTRLERRHVYIYRLESVSERRQVYWDFEPYYGGASLQQVAHTTTSSSSPQMQCSASTPLYAHTTDNVNNEYIWSLDVHRNNINNNSNGDFTTQFHHTHNDDDFRMATRSIELPGTSFVKSCHLCNGRGRKHCTGCQAAGYEVCYACVGRGNERVPTNWTSSAMSTSTMSSATSGTGPHRHSDTGRAKESALSDLFEYDERTCSHCHGAGKRRCLKCAGNRYIACHACNGKARLRCFMKLIVTWITHSDEHTCENHQYLPNERVKFVTGELLLSASSRPRVRPLSSFPVYSINECSHKLIAQHLQQLRDNNERLLKQRHIVIAVDVNIIDYEWKNKSGYFVIYGKELKVFFPNYPSKSICSIT